MTRIARSFDAPARLCAYRPPHAARHPADRPARAGRRWPLQVLLLVAVARGALDGPDEMGAMAFPALLLGSFSAALYATPRWLAYPAAAVPTVAMSLAGLGEITYAPAIAIPARTMRAWHALVWIRLADREAPRRR